MVVTSILGTVSLAERPRACPKNRGATNIRVNYVTKPQAASNVSGKGFLCYNCHMKIITTPDPRLREKSEKVRQINDEIHDVIAKMRQLSTDWEKDHPYELSAAMAAPQMGILKRIIIVRDDMEDKNKATFTALINPEVIRADGKVVKSQEGCLSVPTVYGMVPRHSKVRVKAKLEDGTEVRIKATGELARTLLHEIDHLNGILFIDHIKGVKDAFCKMDDNGELIPVDYDTEIANNQELWGDD